MAGSLDFDPSERDRDEILLISSGALTDIADAIRTKKGVLTPLTVADMPTYINSITTGGSLNYQKITSTNIGARNQTTYINNVPTDLKQKDKPFYMCIAGHGGNSYPTIVWLYYYDGSTFSRIIGAGQYYFTSVAWSGTQIKITANNSSVYWAWHQSNADSHGFFIW